MLPEKGRIIAGRNAGFFYGPVCQRERLALV